MNITRLLLLSSILMIFCCQNAQARGDKNAGEKKSQVCAACHGADGQGTLPTYPILAGQHESYLAHALRAYREGTRSNVIMAGMAANLSNRDIEDLASYYASLPGLKELTQD